MSDSKEYVINCLAMAIVNHTNEKNGVGVDMRQKNNDTCFDFAVEKIKEFISRTGKASEIIAVLEEAKKSITEMVLDKAYAERDNIKPGEIGCFKVPVLNRIDVLLKLLNENQKGKCKYCGGNRNPKHSFFNSHECCIKCFMEKKYVDDPKYKGTGYDRA